MPGSMPTSTLEAAQNSRAELRTGVPGLGHGGSSWRLAEKPRALCSILSKELVFLGQSFFCQVSNSSETLPQPHSPEQGSG